MGTWTFDVESGRATWDEALEAIFGLAPGAFPGRIEAFLELVHPDDRDRVASSALALAGPTELEYRIVRPDGSI